MIEVSAEVRELFRYFGIRPPVAGKNVGIQVESCFLDENESNDFLIYGQLPDRLIDQPLVDIPLAKDDN